MPVASCMDHTLHTHTLSYSLKNYKAVSQVSSTEGKAKLARSLRDREAQLFSPLHPSASLLEREPLS